MNIPYTGIDVNKDLPDGDCGPSATGHWMNERQRHLDLLHSRFRCSQYDERKIDWDGHDCQPREEQDSMAREAFIPPGFHAPLSAREYPLRFRKPCAPVHYGRVVPLKLSAMLFGAKKHPKVISDDPRTEDWLAGFCEATRFWSRWQQARNNGGAMCTAVVGFKFDKGRPIVEVHDPRWCTPEFYDKEQKLLERFVKCYQYVENVRLPDGSEEKRAYWYRRLITKKIDQVWPKVPVDEEGREPNWRAERNERVEHNFGFVPVVWVQNTPVENEIDGEEDLFGCWDLAESVDMLNSQCRRGTLANIEPTTVIASEAHFDQIKQGVGTALQVGKGESVSTLELTGSGITTGRSVRDDCIEQICTVARVALDRNEGGPSRTVEEVEHVYSSMLEHCDELREQYGEWGVKRILRMVLAAARALEGTKERKNADGTLQLVRQQVKLPKKLTRDPDTGEAEWHERELGDGEELELRWPPYYTPSQQSIAARVTAAGEAKEFGLLDAKHASSYIAEDFGVENVPEMLKSVVTEQKAASALDGGSGGDDLAQKVVSRTLSGAKNPLPNPTARVLSSVAKRAAS